MKLSVTDKFLWDVYNAISNAGDIFLFLARRPTMAHLLPGDENPIFEKYRKEKGKKEFSKLIYYLKRKNYIKVKSLESNEGIMLTKEGIDKVLKVSFKVEEKKKRKDGKWIMLIFDIPQKYKKSRNLMTSVLYNLGYKMFQQSVWVTPYDISDKTEKSLQFYSLDKFVKIFLIKEI